MSNHEGNTNLSPSEIKFNDLIKRGDDLKNIKQYRYAKDWYERALNLNVNNKIACEKLLEVNESQKSTNKNILIVLAVAAAVIGLVYILNL